MTIEEKVVDKIRKLYAKAESCKEIGNQEEAEAFAAMVNKLLIKHNLDMAVVEWSQRNEEDPIEKVWVDFKAYGLKTKRQRQQWSEMLGEIIAKAHFCKYMVMGRSNKICFIGHKSNRQVVEYLFVTMCRLAQRMGKKAYADYWKDSKVQGKISFRPGFKSAWLHGFIKGLNLRFKKERKAVDVPSNTTALVRLNQILTVVDEWIKKNTETKKASSLNQFRYNSEGFSRGEKAAHEISLKANALREGSSQGQRQVS